MERQILKYHKEESRETQKVEHSTRQQVSSTNQWTTCETKGKQSNAKYGPGLDVGLNILDQLGKYEYNLGIKMIKTCTKWKNWSLTEKSRW